MSSGWRDFASSAPLPELLPDLDQFLNGMRAGDVVVDHAAASMRGVVGLTNGIDAEAGEISAQMLEVVRGHDVFGRIFGADLRTASHSKRMLAYSPFVRYTRGADFEVSPRLAR